MAIDLSGFSDSTTTSGQLSTKSTHVRIIEWHARADNKGNVVVGFSSAVSATNGRQLVPGEALTWNFSNLGAANEPGLLTLSDLYVHIGIGGDVLDWTIFISDG